MHEPAALTRAILEIAHGYVQEVFSAVGSTTLFKAIKRVTVATTLQSVFIAFIAAHSANSQEPAQAAIAGVGKTRVVLPHSTHPATQTASDLGRVPEDTAMDRMVLVLAGDAGREQSWQELL